MSSGAPARAEPKIADEAALSRSQTPARSTVEPAAGARLPTLPEQAARNGGIAGVWELHDVPLGHGEKGTLRLYRFNNLASSEVIHVVDAAGVEQTIRPQATLYRGQIAGEPESLVVLGLSPAGTHGLVRRADGRTLVISSGSDSDEGAWITPLEDLPLGQGASFCDMDDPLIKHALTVETIAEPDAAGRAVRNATGCQIIDLAVETDFEFPALIFRGNAAAAAGYLQTLFAATSEIYRRDVGVEFRLTHVRLWSTNNDPWGRHGGTSTYLSEVQSWWNANETEVPRQLVHMVSGRGLNGGRAYLGALCFQAAGYGISTSINGSFPSPVNDHDGANWDLFVVAHELGHNVGTHHTHEISQYNPVIDGCGLGDCSDAYGGTIMSYCHQCDGGMANIQMRFHPRVISLMQAALSRAASCLDVRGPAEAVDDEASGTAGTTIEIDVLLNDQLQACGDGEVAGLTGADATSAAGGIVRIQENGRLAYTPPAGWSGTDTFGYRIGFAGVDVANARVVVQVDPACAADRNGDGQINVADLLAYLSSFRARDLSADMNNDGALNVQDLLMYLAAFRARC